MDDSLVILGRQPALGLAELESIYGGDKVRPVGDESAVVNIMPCSIDFERLGGAIKLCKVLTVLDTNKWPDVQKFLEKAAPEHSKNMPDGKMQLGLSVYGLSVSPQQIIATGLSVKKAIRKTGRSVRLTPNQEPALNSAQVIHNHLTGPNGWELVFVSDSNKIICAQTLFVQDIDSYTLRDRSRPKRDSRVGMLPPKLAQIIINLAAGTDEILSIPISEESKVCLSDSENAELKVLRAKKTVLDPFCGTGVVLQEAALMGYGLYGSDLEPRMIDYTSKNLEWLETTYKLPELKDKVRLEVGDATKLEWQTGASFVASELYLGQPLTSLPRPDMLEQMVHNCNLITKKFLQNIFTQLEPGTRLCLAVPAWQHKNDKFLHLPLLDQLEQLGYNRIVLKHADFEDLVYYRSDQIVARELLVLTRK